MAFPARLLNEGEEIVLDLRPHWSVFALPALALVAAVGLLVALSAWGWPEWLQMVSAVLTLAALGRFAVRYARWAATNFVVTTDRLIHRRGVVSKQGIEIPLERVNTVFFRQTLLERLLRTGDLVIESGGERGRQAFSDIPRPSLVQNEIYRQIEDNHERMYGGSKGPAELSLVEQLERLDGLRLRGVVSQVEFEAEKARLLARPPGR
ncbi:MAG TPA: PH domain-containing protein [Acidimicrobiales bacterium]|jgi:membrane protein YdbS with pleckstrin-like domain|nr:PH domain-containing protein [Acidimicrobiales bacterium]